MAGIKGANTNKIIRENSIIIIIFVIVAIVLFFVVKSIIKSILNLATLKKTDLPINEETGKVFSEQEIEMTFDVNRYVEVFRKTTDSCWLTCFHRCPNFEILYDELSDAQLVHTNNEYLKKYKKTIIEEMKGYSLYGCDAPHGYLLTNYGTLLYDRLIALDIKK